MEFFSHNAQRNVIHSIHSLSNTWTKWLALPHFLWGATIDEWQRYKLIRLSKRRVGEGAERFVKLSDQASARSQENAVEFCKGAPVFLTQDSSYPQVLFEHKSKATFVLSMCISGCTVTSEPLFS